MHRAETVALCTLRESSSPSSPRFLPRCPGGKRDSSRAKSLPNDCSAFLTSRRSSRSAPRRLRIRGSRGRVDSALPRRRITAGASRSTRAPSSPMAGRVPSRGFAVRALIRTFVPRDCRRALADPRGEYPGDRSAGSGSSSAEAALYAAAPDRSAIGGGERRDTRVQRLCTPLGTRSSTFVLDRGSSEKEKRRRMDR
ncbi:hypothetical protein KM043_005385 [Ampulex compressa]|nr:hypothetical protein KM043_005385 [Ampulex compressa]